MTIENKIKELGLTLPKATDPVGSYLATKFVGKIPGKRFSSNRSTIKFI